MGKINTTQRGAAQGAFVLLFWFIQIKLHLSLPDREIRLGESRVELDLCFPDTERVADEGF